jgi:hypothetical protein
MPSLLFNRWVKDVNKYRKTSSTSCDNSSTKPKRKQNSFMKSCVETIFLNQTLPHYSTTKNTTKTLKFNLLNKSFTYFPQYLLINLIKEI